MNTSSRHFARHHLLLITAQRSLPPPPLPQFFEVYHGPITSRYSEVFWKSMTEALPEDIVKRFDGKAMAIVGIETDQVRKTPEGDVRVPISASYNHHHDTAVVGQGSRLVELPKDDPRVQRAGQGNYIPLSGGKAWVAEEHTPSASGLPTSAMFSDGNGGEYRKSFHAYAPPFAMIVESPETLSGSPMQIDTWNRDKMNISHGGPTPFVPGPVPRTTLAPTTGPDAIYSGLLECPMTTRIGKVFNPGSQSWNETQAAHVFGCTASERSCAHNVSGAAACFAAKLPGLEGANVTSATVHDANTPPGCSVSVGADGGSATITYNTNGASSMCCSGGEALEGSAASLMLKPRLQLSTATGEATITLSGPAGAWFGIGFGATLMIETPYAIIIDGTGAVTERKLANHAAGTLLASSLQLLSNVVEDGTRTVVLSRPLKGASTDHYTFSSTALTLDLVAAVGSSSVFGYHKSRTAATLQLWPSDGKPACVCNEPAVPFGQGSGQIKYLPTGETVGFPPNRCAAYPRGVLIDRRNPTCDLRTCERRWT